MLSSRIGQRVVSRTTPWRRMGSIRPFFWSTTTEEEEDSKKSTTPKNKSVGAASAPQQAEEEQHQILKWRPEPMKPFPKSPSRTIEDIPSNIVCPPYAATGNVPYYNPNELVIFNNPSTELQRMKAAAQLARRGLELACDLVTKEAGNNTLTTEDVDYAVHDFLVMEGGAYPSPLNYHGFPKSICSSINEVICHGIPDLRPLQFGDIASFDISCYLDGVHGDNCGTILVGDNNNVVVDDHHNKNEKKNDDSITTTFDWRGIKQRTTFDSLEQEEYFIFARKLIQTTRDALYEGINVCRPGTPIYEIGNAIQNFIDTNTLQLKTNRKYFGHGISHNFHHAPFIQHCRVVNPSSSSDQNNNNMISNDIIMKPGMIFTIEPMIMEGPSDDSYEWTSDQWTVVSTDGGLSAQFEHTVLITETGVEILTILPEEERI